MEKRAFGLEELEREKKRAITEESRIGTNGEVEVFKKLDRFLPATSIIIANPRMGMSREADILVFDPAYGFVFVEVKTWAFRRIQRVEPNGIFITNFEQQKQFPLDQADRYRAELKNIIHSKIGKDPHKIITSVAVFPSFTKGQILRHPSVNGWQEASKEAFLKHHLFSDDLEGSLKMSLQRAKRFQGNVEHEMHGVDWKPVLDLLIPETSTDRHHPVLPEKTEGKADRPLNINREKQSVSKDLKYFEEVFRNYQEPLMARDDYPDARISARPAKSHRQPESIRYVPEKAGSSVLKTGSLASASQSISETGRTRQDLHRKRPRKKQGNLMQKAGYTLLGFILFAVLMFIMNLPATEGNTVDSGYDDDDWLAGYDEAEENPGDEQVAGSIPELQDEASEEPETTVDEGTEVREATVAQRAGETDNDEEIEGAAVPDSPPEEVPPVTEPAEDAGNSSSESSTVQESGSEAGSDAAPVYSGPGFTIGSTEVQVKAIMGPPDEVNAILNQWSYDYSSIQFDEQGRVKGWNDRANVLKTDLGSAVQGATFTLGSSSGDVVRAMGTPSEVNAILNQWSYDYSSVSFDEQGKVKGWSDRGSILNADMGSPSPNAYFTKGSSKEEVIAAMGTPSEVNAILNQWSYEYSSIQFGESGIVEGWNNRSGNLRVK
ncbi:NERD domain-containing protein [Bhargavaea cecembensis]|uniref:NERD domain-containing protein n=1 Tax=Bhargavaea cecembensis TaxID=394098 RepID=UPI00058F600F|nr:NERD domain-containing protein [Bhargavaea cecembensis]